MLPPVLYEHRPFIRGLSRYQIQLLGQRVVAGKRAFCLGHLPKLTVEILDGVCGINDPANLLRVFKHGGKLIPVIPP